MRGLFVLTFLVALLPSPATAEPLRIVAAPDVIADYARLLAGRPPLQVNRFDGPGSRRDVVELLLVQQALALGGEHRAAELVAAPTYKRMLAMVADGHADLTGSSVWGSDIDADAGRLQASGVLIADGDFAAGFFHASRTDDVRERIRLGHWSGLSAVSSRAWSADWNALQRLGLAHVYDVGEWPSMVRMVAAGRADFLLAPFQPGSDPDIHAEGVVLVPVPGACLALAGSRHIALPRSPAGDLIRSRLDNGLEQLRRARTLQRAYTEAGFLAADARHCHAGGPRPQMTGN